MIKKIEGKITILINSDETTIEVEDKNSRTMFLRLKLNPEGLSAALSRHASVPCDLEVSNLDRVGKNHEHEDFEFEIPNKAALSRNWDELRELAQAQLSDGWIVDKYFGSKNSFFTRNDKQYARCTIRRYNDIY